MTGAGVLQLPTDATLAPAQMATQSLSYETPFEPHTGRYVVGQPPVGQLAGLTWALPARVRRGVLKIYYSIKKILLSHMRKAALGNLTDSFAR